MKLIKNGILILAIFLLSFLALCLLIFHTDMKMDSYEIPYQSFHTFAFLGLAILFSAALFALCKFVLQSQIKVHHITIFFSLVYLLLASFMIIHSPSGLRADVSEIIRAVADVQTGNYRNFSPGSYFFYYPHQLGLLSFFQLLSFLSLKGLFFVNFLAVLSIQLLQVEITKAIFQEEKTIKLSALLSYLFLPLLFFILFLYNTLFSLFFSYLGIFFCIKFFKKTSWLNALAGLLFFCIAVVLRKNLFILLIAIAIPLILFALKQKKMLFLLFAIVLILLPQLANKGLITYYEQQSQSELKGLPSLAWVNLGLKRADNGVAGAYSPLYIVQYDSFAYDTTAYTLALQEQLQEKLLGFIAEPKEALRFFWEKISATWTNPFFQSLWSGPLTVDPDLPDQTIENPYLSMLFDDSSMLYKSLAFFLRYIVLIIYAGSAYALWRLRKEEIIYTLLYIPLFFLGAFFFHLIWETKSQYVVGHVFMLIPLAGYGLAQCKMLNKKKTI